MALGFIILAANSSIFFLARATHNLRASALFAGGWDQTSSRSSPQDRHACPDPAGGQLPPPSQRPRTSNSFFGGAAAGDGEVRKRMR